MRSRIRLPALRNVLGESHGLLASLLLAGTMLVPLLEAAMGWPVHTPLGVPLVAHAIILVIVGGVALGVVTRARAPWLAEHGVAWILAPPIAVGLTAILHTRANAFYTERVLLDGMALLCVVHLGVAGLRDRVVRRLSIHFAETAPPHPWWRGGSSRRSRPTRSRSGTPGVRLSDALTRAVGWILLTSWVLIALQHRHPAGPLLLSAGIAQLLALLSLVPEALAGVGWSRARASRSSHPAEPVDRLRLSGDDAHPSHPPLEQSLWRQS